MERFLARYRPLVTGVLSGFDRLVFRGSIQALMRKGGMYTLLHRSGVQLLDFKDFVLATSERLKSASLAEAESTSGRSSTCCPARRTKRPWRGGSSSSILSTRG